jgi:hypothetical protein
MQLNMYKRFLTYLIPAVVLITLAIYLSELSK